MGGGVERRGVGLGVRVDVNEKLESLRKFTKNRGKWIGGGVRVGGCSGWGRSGWMFTNN